MLLNRPKTWARGFDGQGRAFQIVDGGVVNRVVSSCIDNVLGVNQAQQFN